MGSKGLATMNSGKTPVKNDTHRNGKLLSILEEEGKKKKKNERKKVKGRE